MTFDPQDYEKVLRKAVEAGLDNPDLYAPSGTLYQDDLNRFVRQRMGDTDGVKEKFLGTFDDPRKEPGGFAQGKEILDDLRSQPRGTWLVFRHDYRGEGQFRYTAYISAGNGSLGQHKDSFDKIPPFEKIRDRMVGFEVYKMRERVEMERNASPGADEDDDYQRPSM